MERVHPARYAQNVPLGPPLPNLVPELGMERALSASRPWRASVDAVAWPPNRLVLFEAKILKLIDGAAKLPFYKALVASTPELAGDLDRTVLLVLVVPFESEQLRAMVAGTGIQVEVFRPAWISDYVRELNDYWTADAVRLRAEKLRLRTLFGLE